MNELTISAICKNGLHLGEGPHWIQKEKALLYVDITQGDLYKYYADSKRIQKLHVDKIGSGSSASFIIPVEDSADEYVISCGQTLATIRWSPKDGDDIVKEVDVKISTVDKSLATRLNDAKCDPNGRLWGGTMCWPLDAELKPRYKGSLYRFDSKLKPTNLFSQVSISNGLAWSNQLDTFYYIDTPTLTVDAFDYDHKTGDISNRRVVFDFKANNIVGYPDGMTIDQTGKLWIACFSGWQVICIDPMTGKLVRMINLPTANVTSCCFGGPDLSTLFVTSGTMNRSSAEIISYPDSGKTFSVIGLGVKGTPSVNLKLDRTILDSLRSSK